MKLSNSDYQRISLRLSSSDLDLLNSDDFQPVLSDLLALFYSTHISPSYGTTIAPYRRIQKVLHDWVSISPILTASAIDSDTGRVFCLLYYPTQPVLHLPSGSSAVPLSILLAIPSLSPYYTHTIPSTDSFNHMGSELQCIVSPDNQFYKENRSRVDPIAVLAHTSSRHSRFSSLLLSDFFEAFNLSPFGPDPYSSDLRSTPPSAFVAHLYTFYFNSKPITPTPYLSVLLSDSRDADSPIDTEESLSYRYTAELLNLEALLGHTLSKQVRRTLKYRIAKGKYYSASAFLTYLDKRKEKKELRLKKSIVKIQNEIIVGLIKLKREEKFSEK